MKYSRIKRKYNNKKWLGKQLLKQIEKERFLTQIFIVECSRFFRGEGRSVWNQRIYKRELPKCRKKIEFYKGLVGKVFL